MRINKPLSKDQLKAGDLIPAGIYDFQVVAAEDQVSKKGVDMIKLQLKIWLEDGRERTLFDYLHPALEFKVGHFAECVGLYDKYQEGAFSADDCYLKSGQCKVYIQKSADPQYGDKNAIADYLSADEAVAKENKKPESKADFTDDDLPF